jgi:hypothetical protein
VSFWWGTAQLREREEALEVGIPSRALHTPEEAYAPKLAHLIFVRRLRDRRINSFSSRQWAYASAVYNRVFRHSFMVVVSNPNIANCEYSADLRKRFFP